MHLPACGWVGGWVGVVGIFDDVWKKPNDDVGCPLVHTKCSTKKEKKNASAIHLCENNNHYVTTTTTPSQQVHHLTLPPYSSYLPHTQVHIITP